MRFSDTESTGEAQVLAHCTAVLGVAPEVLGGATRLRGLARFKCPNETVFVTLGFSQLDVAPYQYELSGLGFELVVRVRGAEPPTFLVAALDELRRAQGTRPLPPVGLDRTSQFRVSFVESPSLERVETLNGAVHFFEATIAARETRTPPGRKKRVRRPESDDGARAAELEAAIEKNLDDPEPWLVYADWLQSQGDVRGELIVECHEEGDTDCLEEHEDALLGARLAERLGGDPPDLELDWHLGFVKSATLKRGPDSTTDVPKMTATFLARPVCRFIRGLTFGLTDWEGAHDFTAVVKAIVRAGRGKTLEHLFFGAFEYPDDIEISSAPWGNLGGLWAVVPNLKSFKVRGAGGDFGTIELPHCVNFTVETGGLEAAQLTKVVAATWPSLERLELWTGDRQHGATSNVDDLRPLLEARAVPRLRHFGLRNCEYSDEFVHVLAKSKLLEQLTSVDLSMGTLSARGCQTLLEYAPAFAHLELLDLNDCYVPEVMFDRLMAVCAQVNVDRQRGSSAGGGNDERYVAVGE